MRSETERCWKAPGGGDEPSCSSNDLRAPVSSRSDAGSKKLTVAENREADVSGEPAVSASSGWLHAPAGQLVHIGLTCTSVHCGMAAQVFSA